MWLVADLRFKDRCVYWIRPIKEKAIITPKNIRNPLVNPMRIP